jgi:hypothetical protein
VTYAKGLGVHARSEITIALGGNYDRFVSDIGIDDEIGASGSVVFEVWADGVKIYDSGIVLFDTPIQTVDVSVAGANELRLVVTDGGDNNYFDHADWADARLLVGNPPANVSESTVDWEVGNAGVPFNSQVTTTGQFNTQNRPRPHDVNNDQVVTAVDALMVINFLARESSPFSDSRWSTQYSPDVNGDDRVTALDAILIINYLARADVRVDDANATASAVGNRPLVAIIDSSPAYDSDESMDDLLVLIAEDITKTLT